METDTRELFVLWQVKYFGLPQGLSRALQGLKWARGHMGAVITACSAEEDESAGGMVDSLSTVKVMALMDVGYGLVMGKEKGG